MKAITLKMNPKFEIKTLTSNWCNCRKQVPKTAATRTVHTVFDVQFRFTEKDFSKPKRWRLFS